MKGMRFRARGALSARPRSTRGAIAAALAVVVTALVCATAANAHFQTYPYTLKSCPASYDAHVDPVNFVFTRSGDGPTMVNAIKAHTSLDDSTRGTVQSFSSHGVCGEMYASQATGCWNGTTLCTRFHIRVKKTYEGDPYLGVTGVGDAHHEDWVQTCNYGAGGHAVDANGSNGSGFDQGRRALRIAFENAGHGWSSKFWDNKRNFKQCDGDYAGSDGYTVYVSLHSWMH